ncbi:DUF4185 domain-containing protein [Ilumatobacter fluminis]|nr:DUF4185 domain-containing protein [Ilumatobacter fluminis]
MSAQTSIPPTTVALLTNGPGPVHLDGDDLVHNPIGCLPDLEPETLDDAFSGRVGPLIGWDNPHVITLDDDRWIWIGQDAYFDYTGNANDLYHDGRQIQNFAIDQRGSCLDLIYRGAPDARHNFELGDVWTDWTRFFWPLGGERHGDSLWIFWSEMVLSDPPPGPWEGIIRHPVGIWLAEYDPETLARRSFEPAPDPGVFPGYGFAIASDEHHTYLFGNSNLLNLAREGGRDAFHSATQMFLARVPLGEIDERPEYRTADGWSRRAYEAAPISERFWAENTMQPRYLDGRWIAVTKEDGFWGDEVLIDVAEEPWGPWRTVDRFVYEHRPGSTGKLSYQPIILPWSNPTDGLAIAISENAEFWEHAVADPPMYRPAVIHRPWPEP